MLLLVLFLIPFISGLFLVWNKNDGLGKTIAVLVSLVQLAIFVYSVSLFGKDSSGLLEYSAGWIKGFDISFHLGYDQLSVLMVGLSVVLCALFVLAFKDRNYGQISRLLGLILITEASLVAVFAAKDAFAFYFFFELALIPVFIIANLWGPEDAKKFTLKMLIFTVLGNLLMLVNFIVFYYVAQTSDLVALASIPELLPKSINNILFLGFLLAFSIKAPLFPFHAWLPDNYSKSPTPATVLLAALLSKMAIYGMIRILIPLAPSGLQQFGGLAIYFFIVGLIYGSIIAMQQGHIKRLIAYLSFAHMGLMAAAVLTLSEFGVQGAIYQMVAHGFNIFGLFYVAKIIYDKTGSRYLSDLGGMAKRAPILATVFFIIILGNVGLPLTNGFISEFLMLRSIVDYHLILGIVAVTSVIWAAVYLLRLYQKTMFQPLTAHTKDIEDIGFNELLVLVPVVLIIIITGVFPNLILDFSEGFVNTLQLNR